MLVIPAIDLRGGACVRLSQGDPTRQTVFAEDPVAVAEHFAAAGARRLHVVDLDGAFTGTPVHLDVIRRITGAVDVPVEVGGGIRNLSDLERALAAGAHWAILGTAVLEDMAFVAESAASFPGRVLVGLDAREGLVRGRGWASTSALTATRAGRMVSAVGVKQVIYTDIGRDGMLSGPNIEATQELARQTGLSVIASGGVGKLSDIVSLRETAVVDGVIVGKALYTGALDLREAMLAGVGPNASGEARPNDGRVKGC